jgi:predicted RNA binding protein YcfA (HicA-like mRNA interferase family)
MAKSIFNWTFSEAASFLKENGFVYSYVKGSHYFYVGRRNHEPKIVQIPFHGSKALKPRTFKGIVRQSGIPLNDWLK